MGNSLNQVNSETNGLRNEVRDLKQQTADLIQASHADLLQRFSQYNQNYVESFTRELESGEIKEAQEKEIFGEILKGIDGKFDGLRQDLTDQTLNINSKLSSLSSELQQTQSNEVQLLQANAATNLKLDRIAQVEAELQDQVKGVAHSIDLLYQSISSSAASSNLANSELSEMKSELFATNNNLEIMKAQNVHLIKKLNQTQEQQNIVKEVAEKLDQKIETQVAKISEQAANIQKAKIEEELAEALAQAKEEEIRREGEKDNAVVDQNAAGADEEAAINKNLPTITDTNMLMIGGERDDFVPHELFNIEHRQFINTTIPKLFGNPSLRSYKIGWYRAIAFLYNSTTLFVCGGTNSNSRQCLALKGSDQDWVLSKSLALPEIRAGANVVYAPGYGHLVTGGFSSEFFGVASAVLQLEEYNHDSETAAETQRQNDSDLVFKQHLNIKLPRFRHSCLHANHSLICSGGLTKAKNQKGATAMDSVVVLKLDSKESLDHGTFVKHSKLPYPVYDHSMVVGDNGRLYIVGGNDNELNVLEYFEDRNIWIAMNEVLPVEVSKASSYGNFIRTKDALVRFGNVNKIEVIERDLVGREFAEAVAVPVGW